MAEAAGCLAGHCTQGAQHSSQLRKSALVMICLHMGVWGVLFVKIRRRAAAGAKALGMKAE